ncbi:MAG: mechanosensitive ion channel family protein, partial [Flavobacteriales bacterium]|nr:mechanosensitive ion channel family protein [Flavobacteriales bacterium]
LIYIVGISIAIYSMPNLRTLAKSLLAGAGILAVAVGFASQHALSNIISGVFIVIFKPFRINDRISIRSLNGIIEDITLRHVVIRDFENKRIIIPNALISDEIIVNSNFEDESICKWIEIGISYESDIDLAKSIIAQAIEQHPLSIDHRTDEEKEEGMPRVDVRVIGLGEYAVQVKGWAWAANPPDAFEMGCDLFEQIKKEFDKAGIEIPYPHRTIVNKPYGKRQSSATSDQ